MKMDAEGEKIKVCDGVEIEKDHPLARLAENHLADFRATVPIEPVPLTRQDKEIQIEAIREGVGLLRMSWEAAQALYDRTWDLLEKLPTEDPARAVLSEYILRMEGFIHVFFTLMREYSNIWAKLRADALWERLLEERRAAGARRGQRNENLPSREEVKRLASQNGELAMEFEETLTKRELRVWKERVLGGNPLRILERSSVSLGSESSRSRLPSGNGLPLFERAHPRRGEQRLKPQGLMWALGISLPRVINGGVVPGAGLKFLEYHIILPKNNFAKNHLKSAKIKDHNCLQIFLIKNQ